MVLAKYSCKTMCFFLLRPPRSAKTEGRNFRIIAWSPLKTNFKKIQYSERKKHFFLVISWQQQKKQLDQFCTMTQQFIYKHIASKHYSIFNICFIFPNQIPNPPPPPYPNSNKVPNEIPLPYLLNSFFNH